MSSSYTVLLYSDNLKVRTNMKSAIGEKPASDITIEYLEATDYHEAIRMIDTYVIDLMLLDGEAQPTGGMAIARQLRDEMDEPPMMCLVLRRAADNWLAAWSEADEKLFYPLDPLRTGAKVVEMLRSRRSPVAN
ncbi:response regulator receiver domain-containing protein [Stackebrandtia endophytica]|uniref:Response regulator receiver domain-containing protein n=1 Tax=Stackebrandtia endophytica TaxID=1496996 RepID=A0A543B2W6_9ACTN|nr:response regulator [Stackebrandtia endophytica]TQL79164.1 response regulator receiver domain-containing protein [Stackebrandtia endophytica]